MGADMWVAVGVVAATVIVPVVVIRVGGYLRNRSDSAGGGDGYYDYDYRHDTHDAYEADGADGGDGD